MYFDRFSVHLNNILVWESPTVLRKLRLTFPDGQIPLINDDEFQAVNRNSHPEWGITCMHCREETWLVPFEKVYIKFRHCFWSSDFMYKGSICTVSSTVSSSCSNVWLETIDGGWSYPEGHYDGICYFCYDCPSLLKVSDRLAPKCGVRIYGGKPGGGKEPGGKELNVTSLGRSVGGRRCRRFLCAAVQTGTAGLVRASMP